LNEDRIHIYIINQGDFPSADEYGPDIIQAIIDRLRTEENYYYKPRMVAALAAAIRQFPLETELRSKGKDALYEQLQSPDERTRWFTASVVAGLYKADATEALLSMVDDPVERVRLIAIESLGTYGKPETLPKLKEAIARRSRTLTNEQKANDATLHFGQESIEMLEKRSPTRNQK